MAVLRKRRVDEIDPVSDLLFNTLLAFVLLFAIALMAMNPKAKTGVIDAKAEFLITVTWPDLNPNDIDTWVQDPGGDLVWFRALEAGKTAREPRACRLPYSMDLHALLNDGMKKVRQGIRQMGTTEPKRGPRGLSWRRPGSDEQNVKIRDLPSPKLPEK